MFSVKLANIIGPCCDAVLTMFVRSAGVSECRRSGARKTGRCEAKDSVALEDQQLARTAAASIGAADPAPLTWPFHSTQQVVGAMPVCDDVHLW